MCATRGILQLLSPAELEGVMAHELTHVINRDVMVMTLASFFAMVASLIVQFGFFFGGGFGGGYGRGRNEGRRTMFVVIMVAAVVYAISFMLLRALSRYREFAADRGSRGADRTPLRAGLGAAEDQRHDGTDPQPRPAHRGRDERLLHRARAREELADEHVRRPPAAGAAPGGAGAAGVPAAGHRVAVGLLDALTGRHQVKGPAPDQLFAITTAYITLQSEHQIDPAGAAAIVFQKLENSEFEATMREMEEVVTATGGESGTQVQSKDDEYGYRWMVLRNPDGAPSIEDLAVGINAVSSSIEMGGHGERLLCAVFAFRDAQKRRLYFIYNYKRGFWYPFVPAGGATGALDRARAAAEGADGRRTADGARTGAVVSAVGDPDLSGLCPMGREERVGARSDGVEPGLRCKGPDHLPSWGHE